MGEMSRNSGYIFPDPIDPGETACIQVYVPKDTLYLGAFWRAYEFFTQWSAWARDDAHTGKEVAALWKVCFDRARAQFLLGDACVSEDVIIRMNPDTCRLEYKSCDDPTVWFPVQGGSDSFGTYDPRTDPFPVLKPPLFTPPDDKCNAAANTTVFLRQLVGQIVVYWNATVNAGDHFKEFLLIKAKMLATYIFDLILNYVTVSEGIFTGETNTAFALIDFSRLNDDFYNFDWDVLQCVLRQGFNDDGTFNPAEIDTVQLNIEAHYGENQCWYFFGMYWPFISAAPMFDYTRSYAGITDADCSACDGVVVTFDTGGLDYTFPNDWGVVDSDGYAANCGKGVTRALGGHWVSILWVKVIPLAGGQLQQASCKWYGSVVPDAFDNFGLNIFLFDSDGGLRFSSEHAVTDSSEWANFTLLEAATWDINEGDYILVELTVQYGGDDSPNMTYANASILKLDNIVLEGLALFD